MKKRLVLAIAATMLVACSDSSEPLTTSPPAQPAAEQTLPPIGDEVAPEARDENVRDGARATMGPHGVADVEINAPAGEYTLDNNHSSLLFTVRHLGVSNYVMRFTDFDATVDLNPEDIEESSVTLTIQAASVQADFEGDYKAAHPESSFATWQDDLAMSENFLHAGEHPEIRFTSTSVAATDEGLLQVEGDLELRGETKPVTLEVTVVGSEVEHPFTGVGLIGFSAKGAFKRSDFGMDHLTAVGVIGDEISVLFEGEMLQTVEEAASPESDDDA